MEQGKILCLLCEYDQNIQFSGVRIYICTGLNISDIYACLLVKYMYVLLEKDISYLHSV